MPDLFNHYKPARGISPVSVSDDTPFVSQIIDRAGFEELDFVILTGSLGDANATFTVLLEHDDASGFGTAEAVPDTALLGTEAGASFDYSHDNAVRKIGYQGGKRYVRLTITPSGNGSAALVAAVALLGRPRILPQSSQSGA